MNSAPTSTNQTCGIKIVEAETNAEKALNRVAGQRLELAVDIDASTTAALSAAIRIRPENSSHWTEIPMQNPAGKVWCGEFFITEPGTYFYTIEAWVDRFKEWRQNLQSELKSSPHFSPETLLAGVQLIESMVGQAGALDAERLLNWADELRNGKSATGSSITQRALDESLAKLMSELASRHPGRQSNITPEKELRVVPNVVSSKNL